MLLEDDLDGLLPIGALVDPAIARLIKHRTRPTVLVDAYAIENRYDAVISDNFQGAYTAVSYLIERGHRHIGLVGAAQDLPELPGAPRGYLRRCTT